MAPCTFHAAPHHALTILTAARNVDQYLPGVPGSRGQALSLRKAKRAVKSAAQPSMLFLLFLPLPVAFEWRQHGAQQPLSPSGLACSPPRVLLANVRGERDPFPIRQFTLGPVSTLASLTHCEQHSRRAQRAMCQ